jgi:putative tryptophan/tyrosine transport system substrate-binding protein
MRRREFVTLFAGGLVTLRSAQSHAQPQPSKIYRMGYLAPARIPHLIEALLEGLRKFGYIEDQNLKIEYRFPQDGMATLDVLAAELVRLSPDIIVTVATPPAIAAKRATTTIPIVMATAGDPLGSGIVSTLAHPGVDQAARPPGLGRGGRRRGCRENRKFHCRQSRRPVAL